MSTYERDPAKRKVKPVETAQSLLDFDLGESSDDSDFRIEDVVEESDDDSIDSEDGDPDKINDDDGEDDSENSDDSSIVPNFKKKSKGDSSSDTKTVNDLLQRAKLASEFKGSDLTKMLICAGCLGSRSDDSNEIVECDGCGVTVHEGCYGVSDVTSESSTVSSASTEPWFCEACKAGVINPTCELCPNLGGIFKETEVGAWVHLVCALYVPGVAFSEVEKLSGVTLFEMAYNRWGARACCLCEDEMFSRTGICIGCDAGMCRTYFHVTCGQKEGLLAEAHSEEVEQADPFYAHCKLHSDKTLIRKRKRNWLALQLRTEQRKIDLQNSTDTAAQLRTQRKLQKCRKKFIALKEIKNAPWVPTQKMPRLLPTSATACRKLLHKAGLMGIDTVALEMQDAQLAALMDVRKKWHIPPAFSVEFIGYYLERNSRMQTMKRSLQELMDNNTDLLAEQNELRNEYDVATKENNEVTKDLTLVNQQINKMYECIAAVCPAKVLPNIDLLATTPTVQPDIVPRRPVVPTAAALKMGVGFPLNSNPEEQEGKVLSTSKLAATTAAPTESILPLNNECGICRLKTDQHLLAKCDTCHLYYHLGCLKPPLTRLPKKSKLYGWQCSECDKTSDSEVEVMEQKVARRSRTRFSRDGTIVSLTSPTSNSTKESNPEVKEESKPLKVLPVTTKLETGSMFKVKIKPVEPPPEQVKEQNNDDVFDSVKDQSVNQTTEMSSPQYTISKPSKKERKIRKQKQRQGLEYTSSSPSDSMSNSPSKKSRKRSFTSPALTNTPLMSITPIVAESPQTSPSHQDFSNVSMPTPAPPTSMQLSTDTSFLSPNSTFSTLLSSTNNQSTTETDNTNVSTILGEHDMEVSHKSNRKRRKEKHRSRYSPDLLRSTSKAHKHKRKKKSLDLESPEVPHPRITIKIKPIPKPAGSVDPQLFYVPTDSNDGPPPALLKKHKHHSTSEPVAPPVEAVEPPSLVSESMPASSNTMESKVISPKPVKTKSGRVARAAGEGSTRRSAGGSGAAASASTQALTQCDVCLQAGTPVNLVRCDECGKRYHFTCLEPPLNKNPKKRGYSWHCADCDPTEPESN